MKVSPSNFGLTFLCLKAFILTFLDKNVQITPFLLTTCHIYAKIHVNLLAIP